MVVNFIHEARRIVAINNQYLVKLLIVLVFLFGLLLYTVDISSILFPHSLRFHFPLIGNVQQEEVWNWDFVHENDEEVGDDHKSYFVNTPGCRMPKFDVWVNNIEKYMIKVLPVVCKRPLIYSDMRYVWIGLNRSEILELYNVENVEDLNCYYEAFYRKDDFSNEFPDNGNSYPIPYGERVAVTDEFIRVICNVGENEVNRDYHSFFPNRPDVPVGSDGIKFNKQTADRKVNIMILGIDSVSRLNMHRQMNETMEVLLNQMRAIELYGYNKVADNTYPNLMPALAGLDEDEMQAACMPFKNETFDQCHFIWDEFKRRNYTTIFAEDMAWLGLFHYLKPGFKHQFTDFYNRPIIYEMESHIGGEKHANCYMCLGGRRPIDVLFDYANKFLDYIGDAPYFSFFWSTSYTHDYFHYPTLIDHEVASFLRNIYNRKEMENTFLLVMSDHGIRFGPFRNTYQGMMEERQPFLYFISPTWFPVKYPLAMKNLVKNRHRLTTHFDFYETLRDLYDLHSLTSAALRRRVEELRSADPMPRGISLFLPVPTNRSCYLAGISPHWCTCHERQEISKSDPRVVAAARKVVSLMNEMLEDYPQCHRLSLNSISDANLGVSNTAISNRNTTNNFSDVSVRLQTKPGWGEFEGTIRIHENGDLHLTGSISRTNLYGKQSSCIDEYHLKLYCFCTYL